MAVIEKIKLPGSGEAYDLRDAAAIHDVFTSSTIGAVPAGGSAGKFLSGDATWVDLTGITFNIAWDGTGTPVASKIPKGVVVSGVTGTLEASDAVEGCFYLVKTASQAGQSDTFDEYVVVTNGSTKSWEKIGDTTVSVSLNKTPKYMKVTVGKPGVTIAGTTIKATAGKPGVTIGTKYIKATSSQPSFTQPTITVTPATTNIKATASGTAVGANGTADVVGTSATFTVTQPTITVTPATTNIKATSSGGGYASPSKKDVLGKSTTFTTTVTPTTTNIKATASGGGASWNNKDEKTVLTGVKIGSQGTVALSEDTATTPGTGSIQVVSGISSASATDGNVAWNSKDQKTVLTGIGTVTDPSITLTSASSTSTGAIAYAPGNTACSISTNAAVGVSSTDNVLGEATTFTTTVSGGGYASPGSATFVKSYPGATSKLATTTVPNVTGNDSVSANLSNWTFSVTGTTLEIGGGNGTTVTASKVTLGTAKTVATGSLSASGSGASVMTGLGTASTGSALTSLGTQSAYSASTSAVTSGTGSDIVAAATGVSVTTQPAFKTPVKYLTASASGTAVAAGSTANVIGADSTFTVTQPTINVTPSTKYIKATPSGITATSDGTAKVIGSSATLSNAQPTIALATGATAGTGVISVATGITSASTQATVSGTGSDVVSAITGLGTQTGITTSLATGATAGTGVISVATGITSANATGAAVEFDDTDTKTVLTGVKVTAQPTVALATGATAGTGVISVATGITSANATGGSVGTPTITLAAGTSSDTNAVTVGAPGAVDASNITAPSVSLATGTAGTTGHITVGASGAVSANNITAPSVTLSASDTSSDGPLYLQDVSLS